MTSPSRKQTYNQSLYQRPTRRGVDQCHSWCANFAHHLAGSATARNSIGPAKLALYQHSSRTDGEAATNVKSGVAASKRPTGCITRFSVFDISPAQCCGMVVAKALCWDRGQDLRRLNSHACGVRPRPPHLFLCSSTTGSECSEKFRHLENFGGLEQSSW